MATKQQQKDRETAVIRAPHDGSEVGVVALAGPEKVRAALDANVAAAPYKSLSDAIGWANASPYGLQAGVFTTNLQTMFRLHAELDVGAVNGNDIPGFRVDRLPYGGAKASGLGREGVRYAIEEMTERRVLTLKIE